MLPLNTFRLIYNAVDINNHQINSLLLETLKVYYIPTIVIITAPCKCGILNCTCKNYIGGICGRVKSLGMNARVIEYGSRV